MSYSEKRKLGRRQKEVFAGAVPQIHQRLVLLENIVSKLLARDGLVLGNLGAGTFDLVPAPTAEEAEATFAGSDLEVTVVDEAGDTNEPLNPAPENS